MIHRCPSRSGPVQATHAASLRAPLHRSASRLCSQRCQPRGRESYLPKRTCRNRRMVGRGLGSFFGEATQIARRNVVSAAVALPRRARVVVHVTSAGPMKVMIAGPPASGKGTQSQRIIAKYGLEHVCVGDLLREQIAAGTPEGVRAKEYMNRGELVPNEIVVDMVKNSLSSETAQENGWLLDGYPRSFDQATAIEKENIRPDIFLLLQVPDEVLVERVVGRRLDPETGEIYHIEFKPPPEEVQERLVHRFDDTKEKMISRLQTYHSNLDSILDIYKDCTTEINGTGSMEKVFDLIEKALGSVAVAAEP